MSDIWYLNGKPVNDFPGIARVESVGHLVSQAFELGKAAYLWDGNDAEELAAVLRAEMEDAR